jgi:hypothetical protein
MRALSILKEKMINNKYIALVCCLFLYFMLIEITANAFDPPDPCCMAAYPDESPNEDSNIDFWGLGWTFPATVGNQVRLLEHEQCFPINYEVAFKWIYGDEYYCETDRFIWWYDLGGTCTSPGLDEVHYRLKLTDAEQSPGPVNQLTVEDAWDCTGWVKWKTPFEYGTYSLDFTVDDSYCAPAYPEGLQCPVETYTWFDDDPKSKMWEDLYVVKHDIYMHDLALQYDDPDPENRCAALCYYLLPEDDWVADYSMIKVDRTCEVGLPVMGFYLDGLSPFPGYYCDTDAYLWYGYDDKGEPVGEGIYNLEHRIDINPFYDVHSTPVSVSIVDIDMDIGSGCLEEEDEDTGPGAFIFDSIAELTPLTLRGMDEIPCHPDAELTLRVLEGGDKIKIWADSNRTSLLWDPANPGTDGLVVSYNNDDFWNSALGMNIPKYLFLEAVGTSSTMLAGDIELRWAWEADRIYSDIVKLTAVELPPLTCPAVLGASNFRAPGYDPFPAAGGGCTGTSTDPLVCLDKFSENWEPKGGDEDNFAYVTARIIRNCDELGQFIFELEDVSDEPGYCLNAPNPCPVSGEDSSTWKDLQFPPEENPDFTISGTGNSIATSDVTTSSFKVITVKCYDYGAFGKIKVKYKYDGQTAEYQGQEYVPSGPTGRYFTKIPDDDNNNDIWDGAYQDVGPGGSYLPNDDNEGPVGHPSYPGDLLSRYEEYRGFRLGGSAHYNGYIDRQDVFIYDQDNLGQGHFGTLGYQRFYTIISTAFKEEIITKGVETNFKRYQLNFNYGSYHIADVYAIHLLKQTNISLAVGETLGQVNNGARCKIPHDYLINHNAQPYIEDDVISHELGHAVYIYPPSGGGHGHKPTKDCIMDWQIDFIFDPDRTSYCNTATPTDSYICNQNHRLH